MKCDRVWVLFVSIGLCISAWAIQQNTPAAPPATAAPSATATAPVEVPPATLGAPAVVPAQVDLQAAVKERANAFYTSLTGGDRKAAEQMVAPESRDDFDQADFKALAAFTVDKIAVDPSGGKADVTVTRVFTGPFGMNMPWHDQWVNVDGQWFLALPKNTHQTPFGVMAPNSPAAPVDPEVMKRITERRAQKVDPDQYMKQMEKYLSDHPNALPPTEMQVTMPQQISVSQSQGGAKVAADAKAATSAANADKNNKKKKKKDTKKSEKPQDNATTPPKS